MKQTQCHFLEIVGRDVSVEELSRFQATCFRNAACMLSGPGDLFVSKFSRRFLTPFTVISISVMDGYIRRSAIDVVSSMVNTDLK